MTDKTSSQPNRPSTEEGDEQKIGTLWIGVATGLAMSVVAIIYLASEMQSGRRDFLGVYVTGALAIVGFLAAILAQREIARVGSLILIITTWAATLLVSFLPTGQATAPSIAGLLIVTAVSSYSLPTWWRSRVGIISIVISTAVIVSNLYSITSSSALSNPSPVVPASIGLVVLYTFFILRRFNFYALRFKLLITFILVATVPLGILGLYNNIVTRNLLREQGNSELRNLAELTASQVDAFIGNQLDFIRWTAFVKFIEIWNTCKNIFA